MTQQIQCRVAKKMVQKKTKKKHPRVPFTKDEDKLLKKLVEKHKTINWAVISKKIPGRNARQCGDRWLNYLSPKVCNCPWAAEKDELLVQKYEEIGPYWKQIATFFPNRTDINIKSRWNLRERHMKKQKLQIAKKLYYQKILNIHSQNPSGSQNNINQQQLQNQNDNETANPAQSVLQNEISNNQSHPTPEQANANAKTDINKDKTKNGHKKDSSASNNVSED